jgi:hypothetical protein
MKALVFSTSQVQELKDNYLEFVYRSPNVHKEWTSAQPPLEMMRSFRSKVRKAQIIISIPKELHYTMDPEQFKILCEREFAKITRGMEGEYDKKDIRPMPDRAATAISAEFNFVVLHPAVEQALSSLEQSRDSALSGWLDERAFHEKTLKDYRKLQSEYYNYQNKLHRNWLIRFAAKLCGIKLEK